MTRYVFDRCIHVYILLTMGVFGLEQEESSVSSRRLLSRALRLRPGHHLLHSQRHHHHHHHGDNFNPGDWTGLSHHKQYLRTENFPTGVTLDASRIPTLWHGTTFDFQGPPRGPAFFSPSREFASHVARTAIVATLKMEGIMPPSNRLGGADGAWIATRKREKSDVESWREKSEYYEYIMHEYKLERPLYLLHVPMEEKKILGALLWIMDVIHLIHISEKDSDETRSIFKVLQECNGYLHLYDSGVISAVTERAQFNQERPGTQYTGSILIWSYAYDTSVFDMFSVVLEYIVKNGLFDKLPLLQQRFGIDAMKDDDTLFDGIVTRTDMFKRNESNKWIDSEIILFRPNQLLKEFHTTRIPFMPPGMESIPRAARDGGDSPSHRV